MSIKCVECYSEHSRITPLLEPGRCLENHEQYICGACGRCICIDRDEKRNVRRWNFPFKSLDIAKLYLRTADVSTKKPCGIYEIENEKGRKSYKIFPDTTALNEYLSKNKGKTCRTVNPVYRNDNFRNFTKTQIRKLSPDEVELYLNEQKRY